MKTLKNLPVPQDLNRAKWPFGQLKNETETEAGTPVVKEIYGDILVNIYKILQDAGIAPNEAEDSELTGYQLLQALKKFTNELNDIEHIVSLAGTTWNVNLDIDNLPNKYVMFCRMAEAYNKDASYTFSGTGDNVYSLTSPTGFKASDEVLVVLDHSGVRIYSLSSTASSVTTENLFPVFGTPLAYNDSETLYYESEGALITDSPSIVYLQQKIRFSTGNSTLYVNEILILKGCVFCVVFDTNVQKYHFFQFSLEDLDSPSEIAVSGVVVPEGFDNSPYVYTDGEFIYITNASGNSLNDYELDKFSYNPEAPNLDFIQTIEVDQSFQKTTNAVIKEDKLVSFVDGSLSKYDLQTGTVTELGQYNTLLGILFRYKDEVYYSNGEVAKKWTV